jgi:hypothetical protein
MAEEGAPNLVESLRRACEALEGELAESKSLVKCDISDEDRVTLSKDGRWMKFYSEGRLRVWGVPEKISVKEVIDPFSKHPAVHVAFDFKDPELMSVGIDYDKVLKLGLMSPPFAEREQYIARQFMEEYLKRVKRALIAARAKPI